MPFGCDSDEGASERIDEARRETVRQLLRDPRELINKVRPFDRQDWFDRLKTEAIRLGVKP